MALTAKQRNALPRSAFAMPAQRKYPMPTKAQARKAGIGERQRLNIHRNALSRGAQGHTRGTYRKMATVARARTGGAIKTVSKRYGTVHAPGLRKGAGRK